ncbi:insulinase family protein, partial [Listeria monocytogenes]|nr:insulinase family protein [Listeria monocytogenes]
KQTEKIKEAMKEAAKNGLNESDLALVKRKRIGQFLRSLNSPEFIANQFSQYVMKSASLFDILPLMEEVTLEEVNAFVKNLDQEERTTSFQLLPEQ